MSVAEHFLCYSIVAVSVMEKYSTYCNVSCVMLKQTIIWLLNLPQPQLY